MPSTSLARALLGIGACVALSFSAMADDLPESIRIGYAVSDTGPYAGGAGTTITPNYELWAEEVNKAGGIRVGDRQLPIEVVAYDDRSSSEEAVRAVERLINQDEVHFVLPPWGTALNLAVAPVLHRAGYPRLAVTAVSDRQQDLMDRWSRIFFFLSTSSHYAEGIVTMLEELRESGVIEGRVAMVNVADQFGIELAGQHRSRAGGGRDGERHLRHGAGRDHPGWTHLLGRMAGRPVAGWRVPCHRPQRPRRRGGDRAAQAGLALS
ncbi:ABC transporter substrate-binding protein [Billgrantia endophytica]|uniref:ABC transporter substrate-binding protein n=1 Tax=Billgrantia endophytica TaxID=2033802 RepID=UPI00197ADACB|nr:ABC transporter substrate-binding protein [Halomonas endophytica]